MITTSQFDHYIPYFGHRTKTTVRLEITKGVFQSLLQITAFDGEVNIFIHGSHGHQQEFVVVILQCDAPILTKNFKTRQEALDWVGQSNEVFNWDGSWWKSCYKWVNEVLNTPVEV